MLTQAPRGTRDILPDQVYKWNYLEKIFRDICGSYGFEEIRTPMFEHTELFKRGVGDTTDIVEKQMYSFDDNGGRNITLKPEGTASAVRAFVENKMYSNVQPTKLFYITPCFRYERPQAGRLRQFHQFGIEVFGSSDPLTDAEVIGVAIDFFNKIGIKNLELRINSIGCPDCRNQYREALRSFLSDKLEGLCETCKGRYDRNPMRILDCKSEACRQKVQGAPKMIDYLCEACRDDFNSLQDNLSTMNIDFVIDPDIVRGLDYYTKTAFEIISNEIGAQGTVCGGGRYDNLIEELGGPSTPGVGFGMGIERLILTLEKNNIDIPKENLTDVFVAVLGEESKKAGIKILKELRCNGIKGQMDLLGRNLKSQFKYADKLNAAYCIVVGEEELKENAVLLKDMRSSEQEKIELSEIIDVIKKRL
ncbi:MAG: histidine--tRNA ligase [Clostridiales bacterium]|nr:histidine--tRNA ligase [Clostridiales bacterium]